ncbi:MAG: hypothetical protein NVSMB19_07370 [Vulcanimicrobiaceae bacterium]
MSRKDERTDDVTPGADEVPSAHPLALELSARSYGAAAPGDARVLLLGIGSGRNVPAFLAAGLRVDAIESDPQRAIVGATHFAAEPRVRVARARYRGPLPFAVAYDAALSTHALLHGTPEQIAAGIRAAADRLTPGAPFYATLGSQRDPRFGTGERLGDQTFAPLAGPERGIAHTSVTAAGARALFADFVIDSLEEVAGGERIGRWAHDDAEAATIVHWYVRARRGS